MEQSAQKKKIPVWLIATIVSLTLIIVLTGAYFGLCAWVRSNGRLLPKMVVTDRNGGVVAELGGLSQDDAIARMSEVVDVQSQKQTITISYGEENTATLSGQLLSYDPKGAVERGMAVKDQPFHKLGAMWLGLADYDTSLSLSTSTFTQEGQTKATQLAKQVSEALYVAPVDYTFEVKDGTVTVVKGTDGQEVNSDELMDQLLTALSDGQTSLTVTTHPVSSAELSGQLLSELVYLAPKSPELDANGKLTPTVVGRSLNPDEAQTILDSIGPGEACSIPMAYIQPDLGPSEKYLYKDLLATVTSNLDGVAARSHNVALSASACNGVVILPDQVFSYLNTIGSPSTARGYRTSTGYQNGETVDMVGGGICQVSSSLYYCAVYSNLDIVRRATHAFTVGYLPNGLDATVYYPTLDFKFRNNTQHPIKIVSYVSNNKLTVQFYGTNTTGNYVETQRYTRSSTPWKTVYEPSNAIPRGTTRIKTTPYTGYEVDVYRLVYNADGTLLSRVFENHSRYAKRDRVILYNPLDAAALGLSGPSTSSPEPSVPPSQTPTPPPIQESTPPPVQESTPPPTPEPPSNQPEQDAPNTSDPEGN